MKILVTRIVEKTVVDFQATGIRAEQARKAKGWTYREAAERMGCSFAYLSDLEKGYRSWSGKIGKRYIELLEKA